MHDRCSTIFDPHWGCICNYSRAANIKHELSLKINSWYSISLKNNVPARAETDKNDFSNGIELKFKSIHAVHLKYASIRIPIYIYIDRIDLNL